MELRQELIWIGSQRKPNVDRFAHVVAIDDFGLGERGSARWTPERRAQALVDVSACNQPLENPNDAGFEPVVHRLVWLFPKPKNSQSLELLGLNFAVLGSVRAAGFAEFKHRRRDLLLGKLFGDRLLDGQAMVVEPRNVWRAVAHHRSRLQHEVL